MKPITIILFTVATLFSLSAEAEVTVQTYNGYDHTYSDPNLRENVDQDAQDVRDTVDDDEAAGDDRSEAADNYYSHSAGRR